MKFNEYKGAFKKPLIIPLNLEFIEKDAKIPKRIRRIVGIKKMIII